MKISELTKDTLIVTVTPDGFERAYLVDHVGRERVSVTVVGGREQGKEWTACAAIEQQVSLDTGAFFVLAGPAIGGLVRSWCSLNRTRPILGTWTKPLPRLRSARVIRTRSMPNE